MWPIHAAMRLPPGNLKRWCLFDGCALLLIGAMIAGAKPPPAHCAQIIVPMQAMTPGFVSLSAKAPKESPSSACIRLLFEE